MYKLNWSNGIQYGSKWGVSDWCKDFEDAVRTAIELNKPFDTDWVCCQKGVEAFRVRMDDDGDINSTVWESIDDVEDLVESAIWEVFENDEEIPDEDIKEITDMLWSDWNFTTEKEFDCDFSFRENSSTDEKIQQLKDTLDKQIDFTNEELEWSYKLCKEIVEEFFTEKYGWEVKEA